jgi:hypothetical protein
MFAAGDVELIGEREGDRAARVRAIAVAVQANDPGNARILAGARDRNLVAELDRAARDVAGIAAEIAIRPGQALQSRPSRASCGGATSTLSRHSSMLGPPGMRARLPTTLSPSVATAGIAPAEMPSGRRSIEPIADRRERALGEADKIQLVHHEEHPADA